MLITTPCKRDLYLLSSLSQKADKNNLREYKLTVK